MHPFLLCVFSRAADQEDHQVDQGRADEQNAGQYIIGVAAIEEAADEFVFGIQCGDANGEPQGQCAAAPAEGGEGPLDTAAHDGQGPGGQTEHQPGQMQQGQHTAVLLYKE